MRGQKACITISRPIPKDLTQVRASTIRDAELQAARDTIGAFDRENASLRQGINVLTEKITMLQATVCDLMNVQSALTAAQAQASVTVAAAPSFVECSEPGALARAFLTGTPGARYFYLYIHIK